MTQIKQAQTPNKAGSTLKAGIKLLCTCMIEHSFDDLQTDAAYTIMSRDVKRLNLIEQKALTKKDKSQKALYNKLIKANDDSRYWFESGAMNVYAIIVGLLPETVMKAYYMKLNGEIL